MITSADAQSLSNWIELLGLSTRKNLTFHCLHNNYISSGHRKLGAFNQERGINTETITNHESQLQLIKIIHNYQNSKKKGGINNNQQGKKIQLLGISMSSFKYNIYKFSNNFHVIGTTIKLLESDRERSNEPAWGDFERRGRSGGSSWENHSSSDYETPNWRTMRNPPLCSSSWQETSKLVFSERDEDFTCVPKKCFFSVSGRWRWSVYIARFFGFPRLSRKLPEQFRPFLPKYPWLAWPGRMCYDPAHSCDMNYLNI